MVSSAGESATRNEMKEDRVARIRDADTSSSQYFAHLVHRHARLRIIGVPAHEGLRLSRGVPQVDREVCVHLVVVHVLEHRHV